MNKRYKGARFWDFFARSYARSAISDVASYEYKLKRAQSYLQADMKALEFGCGTGTTALRLAPFFSTITGLDFSPAMIEIAEQKRQAAGIKNADFAVSTLEDWQGTPEGYDVLMGHSILHLVNDLDETLTHTRRHLKKGGLFFSSTFCARDEMGPLVRLVLLLGRIGLMPKARAFSADELRQSIAAAGFEEVEFWRPGPTGAVFVVARAI